MRVIDLVSTYSQADIFGLQFSKNYAGKKVALVPCQMQKRQGAFVIDAGEISFGAYYLLRRNVEMFQTAGGGVVNFYGDDVWGYAIGAEIFTYTSDMNHGTYLVLDVTGF
ncbi:hypothetical protein C1141_21705 [Vibrio agarivorans]|nr:hypothetical protein C1141_21705 [Vibrio agarivorans]